MKACCHTTGDFDKPAEGGDWVLTQGVDDSCCYSGLNVVVELGG